MWMDFKIVNTMTKTNVPKKTILIPVLRTSLVSLSSSNINRIIASWIFKVNTGINNDAVAEIKSTVP